LGPRVSLVNLPPSMIDLAADPSGGRLAVPIAPGIARIFWLLDGRVVGSGTGNWPPKWAAEPTLDERLVEIFAVPDRETAQRLLQYALKTGGEPIVVDMMSELGDSEFPRWAEVYESLKSADLKQQALAAIDTRMREGPSVELVSSLINYPELQPKDFTDVL